MAVSAKDVMDLRSKTGLGMMECKMALAESNGDMNEAESILRKKGLIKMTSREDRVSREGRVGIAISADRSRGAIIEINTETDFTAKTEGFGAMVAHCVAETIKQDKGHATKSEIIQSAIDDVRLTTKENVQFARGRILGGHPHSRVAGYVHFTGKVGVIIETEVAPGSSVSDDILNDLCLHVTAVSPTPLGVTEADIPADILEKEKQIAKAQAMASGKPEQIAEKMVVGKIKKFYEDNCLLYQPFIKDDKKQVKDVLPKGVTIKAFVRYQVGLV